MPALKIAISGISGRMGQILVQAALEDRSVQLAGALARAGSEWTGRDAGARFGQTTGVAVSEDIEAGLAKVEYLIDFTSAEYTLACLPVARRHGIKLVIGTTGFSEQQRAGIEIASRALPIVLAPNMSMGVNLYLKLIETAARLFKDRYDIEIIEAHHRHKADAPSGTALKMVRFIQNVRLRTHSDHRCAQTIGNRFFSDSRRRYCGRSHRSVCRRGRAHRVDPSLEQPRQLRIGRAARGALSGG